MTEITADTYEYKRKTQTDLWQAPHALGAPFSGLLQEGSFCRVNQQASERANSWGRLIADGKREERCVFCASFCDFKITRSDITQTLSTRDVRF